MLQTTLRHGKCGLGCRGSTRRLHPERKNNKTGTLKISFFNLIPDMSNLWLVLWVDMLEALDRSSGGSSMRYGRKDTATHRERKITTTSEISARNSSPWRRCQLIASFKKAGFSKGSRNFWDVGEQTGFYSHGGGLRRHTVIAKTKKNPDICTQQSMLIR